MFFMHPLLSLPAREYEKMISADRMLLHTKAEVIVMTDDLIELIIHPEKNDTSKAFVCGWEV